MAAESHKTPKTLVIRNNERLTEISKNLSMPKTEVLTLLLEFYDLDRIDLLILKLKEKYYEGLNPSQLSQLSVLLTQLSMIIKPTL